MVASPAGAADPMVVDSTSDAGDDNPGDGICVVVTVPTGSDSECTLRAAIQEANATTAADTILFNIGEGSGAVQTIAPETALPAITQPVTIDGYSEPGARENTRTVGNDAVLLVQLNGENADDEALGLRIWTSDSLVKGLVINRFSTKIDMSGEAMVGNRVEGNFIGPDPSGTAAPSYSGHGVYASSYSNGTNMVGGTSPAARNLISGNGGQGILSYAAGLEVLGNYIGTDRTGTRPLGNGYNGLALGASNHTVGGDPHDEELLRAAEAVEASRD